jgi:hypothetical protein
MPPAHPRIVQLGEAWRQVGTAGTGQALFRRQSPGRIRVDHYGCWQDITLS